MARTAHWSRCPLSDGWSSTWTWQVRDVETSVLLRLYGEACMVLVSNLTFLLSWHGVKRQWNRRIQECLISPTGLDRRRKKMRNPYHSEPLSPRVGVFGPVFPAAADANVEGAIVDRSSRNPEAESHSLKMRDVRCRLMQ